MAPKPGRTGPGRRAVPPSPRSPSLREPILDLARPRGQVLVGLHVPPGVARLPVVLPPEADQQVEPLPGRRDRLGDPAGVDVLADRLLEILDPLLHPASALLAGGCLASWPRADGSGVAARTPRARAIRASVRDRAGGHRMVHLVGMRESGSGRRTSLHDLLIGLDREGHGVHRGDAGGLAEPVAEGRPGPRARPRAGRCRRGAGRDAAPGRTSAGRRRSRGRRRPAGTRRGRRGPATSTRHTPAAAGRRRPARTPGRPRRRSGRNSPSGPRGNRAPAAARPGIGRPTGRQSWSLPSVFSAIR